MVRGGNLRGIEIDMNNTPDALPALAVVGCFAEGETKLYNVAQARLKETDRIAVMAALNMANELLLARGQGETLSQGENSFFGDAWVLVVD